jgi:hypothetical protein
MAYGDSEQISYHHKRLVVFTIPLNNNYNGELRLENSNDEDEYLMELHENILFWVWLIGIDFTISIVEFFGKNQFAMILHTMISMILFLITLIFEGMIISRRRGKFDSLPTKDIVAHMVIGLIFLTMLISQNVLGFFLFLIKSNLWVFRRAALIKKMHFVFGLLIYIFGKTNAIIGAKI